MGGRGEQRGSRVGARKLGGSIRILATMPARERQPQELNIDLLTMEPAPLTQMRQRIRGLKCWQVSGGPHWVEHGKCPAQRLVHRTGLILAVPSPKAKTVADLLLCLHCQQLEEQTPAESLEHLVGILHLAGRGRNALPHTHTPNEPLAEYKIDFPFSLPISQSWSPPRHEESPFPHHEERHKVRN